MGYGLQIYDAAGNSRLGPDTRLSRLVYQNSVSGGASSSASVPAVNSKSSVEFSVPTYEAYNYAGHTVSRSGTTINWTAVSGTPGPYYSAPCEIFVFLYD